MSVRSQTPAAGQDAWTVGKAVYASLMGALLLSYLYVMLTYRESAIFDGGVYSYPVFLWILRLTSVGMTLWLGKAWKDKGFWILMAYLLLMVVRLLLENSIRLFALSVSESLLCGLWVYIACYGIARVLSFRQVKQLLFACAAIWTTGMVIFSCIGLYAYWTDQLILNLTGTAYFGVAKIHNRLVLCYYVNPSAATVSLSIIIAMISLLSARRKWIKAVYGIACTILMITLVLSATRTANITAGIGLGAIAGIEILNRFYRKQDHQTGRMKEVLVWVLALLVAGMILMVMMIGLMRMIPVINRMKDRGGFISAALAEGPMEIGTIESRTYIDVGMNGRLDCWKAILRHLRNNPRLLLTGASIFYPMAGIEMPVQLQHSHCRMLMTLLESGIPGLLLYFLFYGRIIRCSLRLVKSRNVPQWVLLLPAVAASQVLGDLAECLTWHQAGTLPILPFLMVACGVISTYGSKKEVACE